jgi:hypothetical protein
MSKRTLITLFSTVSPAWGDSITLPDGGSGGSPGGSDLTYPHPMGGCEDGSAGGWCTL